MNKLCIILLVLMCFICVPRSVFADGIDNAVFDLLDAEVKGAEDGGTTTEHVGDNFCDINGTKKLFRMAGYILVVLKAVIPFIIIFMGAKLMVKAVIDGKPDTIKKQAIDILIRIAVGVIIFMLPTVLSFLFGTIVPSSKNNNCLKCTLKPSTCSVS